MPHALPGEHAPQLSLLIRSRSLRRRAEEALERAAALRRQSQGLLRPAPAAEADRQAREDAEALQWYRVQVREMLAAGWGRAELADVGITDALLRELGLVAPAAE
jgi:hypothetical protein